MTRPIMHRVVLAGCAFVAAAITWACNNGDEISNNVPDCAAGKDDCSGACVDLTTDPANCGACGKACSTAEACNAGTCALSCNGGTTKCGATCVDTRSNKAHCGACGNACAPGEVCSEGACALACGGGASKCDGRCVDTATDPAHCGACGNACPSGNVCSNGTCSLTCQGGTTTCGTMCVVTSSDVANCGSCGNACPSGQVCSNSQCLLSCRGGTTKCGTTCVDTKADPANCGACGNACTQGQVCSAGTCSLACAGGTTSCANRCIDTNIDPANCGACGHVCAKGQVCSAGTCALGCAGGTTNCENRCIDTNVDAANCGTCGHACSDGETCSSGACTSVGSGGSSCGAGTTSCKGVCVDTSSSATNCGACGAVCTAGQVCKNGSCVCNLGESVCGTACANLSTNSSNCGACGNACGDGQVCSGGACVKLTLGTGAAGNSLTGHYPPKIAIVAGSTAGPDLQTKLVATNLFSLVDVVNVSTVAVPTVAQMRAYDGIVAWTVTTNTDKAFGDNLAEYLEAGGGVVLADYQSQETGNAGLKGRYQADYTLSTQIAAADWVKTKVTLGTIHEPNSPLLTDVSTFGYQGTTPSHLPASSFSKNNPIVVASYSDGTPAVVRGVINGHTVVEINGYGSSSVERASNGWDPSTDGARLFANALLFTIPPPSITTARRLDFEGEQVYSTSTAKTVTYVNASSAPKTIAALNVIGTHIGDFVQTPESGLPATLQPGETLVVNVRFSPSGTGLRAATLAATVTGTNAPATTLLTGTGN